MINTLYRTGYIGKVGIKKSDSLWESRLASASAMRIRAR